MTLRASLAERLGRITAADADRLEAEERRTIDRRMHLLSGAAVRVDEAPVERALRRSGLSACPILRRGLLPEPLFGAWCAMDGRRFGGTIDAPRRCGRWPRVEHELVTAPQVRAFEVATVGCREEIG